MLLSTYLFAILDQLRITLFVMRRSFMLWVNNANTGYSDYFFYTDHWVYYLLGKLPAKYQLELRAWFLIRNAGESRAGGRFVKKVRYSLKNTSLTQHDYIFHWIRGRWPLYPESTHRGSSNLEHSLKEIMFFTDFLLYDSNGLVDRSSPMFIFLTNKWQATGRQSGELSFLPRLFLVRQLSPEIISWWLLRSIKPFCLGTTSRLGTSFLYITIKKYTASAVSYLHDLLAKTCSFGFSYLWGLLFLLMTDACLTDDEPLWEPVEWSLVQSWILFIFCFAWIAENLIVSRYGSYTGRDKRVWMAWYKTFWLIEGYYAITYGIVCLFIIVPFYFELNYSVSFVYSWWHWYSRVFFF